MRPVAVKFDVYNKKIIDGIAFVNVNYNFDIFIGQYSSSRTVYIYL